MPIKQLFLLILILFGFSRVNFAQENIQDIRDLYNSVQNYIKSQNNEEIPLDNIQIVQNQNLPAIGTQKISYNFYFTLDIEESDTSTEYYHTLNFVTRTYNIAASVNSYEEFLFNEKGNLIFYYQQLESAYLDKVIRARCYFIDNKLAKFSLKELIEEGEVDNPNDYEENYNSPEHIPTFYLDEYNSISVKCNQIKNLYHMIDEIGY